MLGRKNAICLPDNLGKNTGTHSGYLILICSFTTTMDTRTRLIVTSYVRTLPVLFMPVDG